MKRTGIQRLVAVGLLWILAMSFGVNGVAQAIPVTFSFEGIVCCTIVPSQLDPPIAPNTPFSGFYTFESTAPDQFPSDPSYGRYALSNYSITLLGRTYSMVTPGSGVIDLIGNSSYLVRPLPRSLSGPVPINDMILQSSQFSVGGIGLFTSDALPLVPPVLSGPSIIGMSFFPVGGNPIATQGVLTSLTAVPEPSSLMLMGLGLLGLIRFELRRRRVTNLQ